MASTRALNCFRYAKGNVVASLASTAAVAVVIDGSTVDWPSLGSKSFGSEFLVNVRPGYTVRFQSTNTVAQVIASLA